MIKIIHSILFTFLASTAIIAQVDTTKQNIEKTAEAITTATEETIAKVEVNDSTKIKEKFFNRLNLKDSLISTNQDAIYERPFIGIGKSKTAIGGYVEGNTNYFSEDGVSEGFSMELRRFNIFIYSTISERIKFISELEFEHGTEEIALETALIDFEINPSLNFRTGILLPNIGLVNVNHDSPQWEIIDRPLSSSTIIPTTLSEVGFGFHGKLYPGNNILSYDLYVVNGLRDGIILNEESKTFIPGGKSEEAFGEDNNGMPMYNFRGSLTNRKYGEIGAAYYGGVFNTFAFEGEVIDDKRLLHIVAVDFTTQIKKLSLKGEAVVAGAEIAENLKEIYGRKQYGGFIEANYPIIEKTMFDYKDAKIITTVRFEKVDYNVSSFSNGDIIGDEVTALTFGLSFRPTASSVYRVNYIRHWTTDVLGNPPALLGGIQVGFATYF